MPPFNTVNINPQPQFDQINQAGLGQVQEQQQAHGAQQVDQAGRLQANPAAGLPGPDQVHRQDFGQQAELRGTASGIGSFFSRVATAFREFFCRNNGLTQDVAVNTTLGNLVIPREYAATLLDGIPYAERAAARANLPQLLANRIDHGAEVFESLLYDTPRRDIEAYPARPNELADLYLFLEAKGVASGQTHIEGAMNIEDPDGQLLAFFESCPESYQRSSSHLSEDQDSTVLCGVKDGRIHEHVNVHHGVDLPKGDPNACLLKGRRTLLFAGIPGRDGQGQRLFLKGETWGCRLSKLTQSKQEYAEGGAASRGWKARDIGQWLGHAGSFIASIGKGDLEGSRKERVPSAVKDAYKDLGKKFGKLGLPEEYREMLNIADATGKSGGVRVMMASMRSCLESADMSGASEFYHRLVEAFGPVCQAIAEMPHASHLESRVGNELVFNLNELHQAGQPADFEAPTARDLLDRLQEGLELYH
ncbi:MAG: hypothetical protein HUK26_03235 [Duodenibacillus sp.]|nr:hypothetical protein [Duodenibacillus sp.]